MRVIDKSEKIHAEPGTIWSALTTNEGVRSFFAPDSDVDLAIGGKYEIYFNHTLPYGQRGSEGCRILSYMPGRMLSFSWNAPPAIPVLRSSGELTWVVIELLPNGRETVVRLSHCIPKEGGDWDRYYDYFDRAWGVVINRLKSYCESGPIDWNS